MPIKAFSIVAFHFPPGGPVKYYCGALFETVPNASGGERWELLRLCGTVGTARSDVVIVAKAIAEATEVPYLDGLAPGDAVSRATYEYAKLYARTARLLPRDTRRQPIDPEQDTPEL